MGGSKIGLVKSCYDQHVFADFRYEFARHHVEEGHKTKGEEDTGPASSGASKLD